MPRALPLGAYVARETPVRATDARVKLALLLAATVALFAARSPAVALAAGLAALAVLVPLSGVGASSVVRALRPTAVVLALSLLANAFVADGTADVALVGPLGVSLPGLARGVVAVARVACLVGLALVVSASTTPPELADAVVSLLSPLGLLGVPVADVAMVLSVALRFIPVCAEEFDRIECAQRARGARFDEGPLVARLSRWAGVLVPLVVSLFGRADSLADAMRDRCYRGRGRTRLAGRPSARDVRVLVAGLAACVAACLVGLT